MLLHSTLYDHSDRKFQRNFLVMVYVMSEAQVEWHSLLELSFIECAYSFIIMHMPVEKNHFILASKRRHEAILSMHIL